MKLVKPERPLINKATEGGNTMYLFFDTETTGLPKKWNAPVADVDNWPRLVQIAWQQYDNDGKRMSAKDYIIKPDGYIIPAEAAKVHGITTERAEKEGVALQGVLEEFAALIAASDVLVAHNINFDEKIIGSEFIRGNIESGLFETERICTMKSSTDFCKLPGNYGYKWPKLSELHIKLFQKDFEEAHDASVDIEACARCFWELKKLGIIQ